MKVVSSLVVRVNTKKGKCTHKALMPDTWQELANEPISGLCSVIIIRGKEQIWAPSIHSMFPIFNELVFVQPAAQEVKDQGPGPCNPTFLNGCHQSHPGPC